MMEKDDGLVERLLATGGDPDDPVHGVRYYNPDGPEAADALTAQAAEIEALRKQVVALRLCLSHMAYWAERRGVIRDEAQRARATLAALPAELADHVLVPREPSDAWQKVEYQYDERGNIVLPKSAPFDGKPALIKTRTGIVEAWWADWEHKPTFEDPKDGDGFCWVCYDDAFQCELDDALEWMPIPNHEILAAQEGK